MYRLHGGAAMVMGVRARPRGILDFAQLQRFTSAWTTNDKCGTQTCEGWLTEQGGEQAAEDLLAGDGVNRYMY
jgi:hypothetical protein